MEIVVLGLNHRTAPVDLRERMAFTPERLPEALQQIRQQLEIPECVVLSTCNRVELYCGLDHVNGHRSTLTDFVSRFHSLESHLIHDKLYWHLQPDSIKHLFRVAAGLDSMVLGESEILGQVKDAYQKAEEIGATGRTLRGVFQQAFSVAKDIRTKTQICRGAVSVSSVAVELARKIFSDLKNKNILIFGAGQMGESTVRCLVGRGAEHVMVVNRSYANALALAEQFGGKAVPLDDLDVALVSSDIVICSTSAENFLLTREQVGHLMRQRKNRPFFLIDISVPRNLDPQIGTLDNVYLYNIDDLQGMAAANLQRRAGDLNMCLSMIENKAEQFIQRLRQNDAAPWPSGPKMSQDGVRV